MDDDYIKELSQEEKLAFLSILCKLIRADNTTQPEEVEFLKAIADKYETDKNTVFEIIKTSKNINHIEEAKKIKTRQHMLELIKELCVLANVDEDLHDNELDIIIDVAKAAGIEDEKVILINRWVLDSAIVARTGQIIMERADE